MGISEGSSRVSWKLSRTVLRGGAASNGDSLLDKKPPTGKQPYAVALADRGLMARAGLLGPETWPVWLGEEPADLRQLKALLAPYPSEEMTCWPVSTRVGSVKNNDPSLIEPIAFGVN